MSTHRIGDFIFALWEGSPPQLVQEQVASHTRPGANGVAIKRLGLVGQPFEATLTMHVVSYTRGLEIASQMRPMTGAGPIRVEYNNVDFSKTFNHRYLIIRMELIECQSRVLIVGPNYSYPNGAALQVRFNMTPFYDG